MRGKIQSSSKANLVYIGLVTLLYVICLYMLGRNLGFETLWYDEAGQFFISKGLNHYSDPYSPEGSILDVIFQNANYNQDPGGFSIILHFWSALSDDIVWLRLLPFIFFIGAIVFTCLAVAEITHRRLIAYTSGLLLFALWGGHIPYELRPYSMELCGMAYGLWMIFRLRQSKHITITSALAYSLFFAFFLSARYTIIMFGFIYTIFALCAICKNGNEVSVTNRLITCTTFCIPLIAMVLYSYIFAMRIQNGQLQSWGYITYLQLQHWPFKLYVAGLILSVIFLRWQNKQTRFLTYIFLASNTLFILLGYLKLLPWAFTGNKGSVFVWLWYVTLLCIAVSLTTSRLLKKTWVNYAYLSIALILIVLSNWQFAILGLWKEKQYSVRNMLHAISAVKSTELILVDDLFNPSIRYYYEFMSPKDCPPSYPDQFILFKGPSHSGRGLSGKEYDEIKQSAKNRAIKGALYIHAYAPDPQRFIPQFFIKDDHNFIPLYRDK